MHPNTGLFKYALLGLDRANASKFVILGRYAELSVMDFKRSNSVVHIGNGAAVTLDKGALSRNAPAYTLADSGVVVVHSFNPKNADFVQQDTILRLWQCYLIGNSHKYTPTVVVARGSSTSKMCDAEVYSDFVVDVLNADSAEVEQSMLLQEAPSGRPGIDTSSEWFVKIQEVRPIDLFLFWASVVFWSSCQELGPQQV